MRGRDRMPLIISVIEIKDQESHPGENRGHQRVQALIKEKNVFSLQRKDVEFQLSVFRQAQEYSLKF